MRISSPVSWVLRLVRTGTIAVHPLEADAHLGLVEGVAVQPAVGGFFHHDSCRRVGSEIACPGDSISPEAGRSVESVHAFVEQVGVVKFIGEIVPFNQRAVQVANLDTAVGKEMLACFGRIDKVIVQHPGGLLPRCERGYPDSRPRDKKPRVFGKRNIVIEIVEPDFQAVDRARIVCKYGSVFYLLEGVPLNRHEVRRGESAQIDSSFQIIEAARLDLHVAQAVTACPHVVKCRCRILPQSYQIELPGRACITVKIDASASTCSIYIFKAAVNYSEA